MVKTKNKKGASSDRVHQKKEPKKINPFEVHVNKEKLSVIGRKQKNDRGLPGISRAKAIQKRKYTLLEEYKVQNKNNKFLDKRIGERGNMDNEEKSMARFTALKVKSHNKKNIFNLADDEILTHKGQTLSEIEKFDDTRSDEDDFSDTENKTGNLEANFVKEAHFGGGILRNTGKEGAMTHKDLINQLIVESKKRKAEKQKLKEATLELTEKLDSEWKDLIPLVTNEPKNKKEDTEKSKTEDYDKIMRELKFERRGTVSDRLKTEEETAKEEKESLEQLERERIRRMNKDESDDKPKPKHRSADDLDDDFVYEDDIEENTLSYNQEGESNLPVEATINGNTIKPNGDAPENDDEAEQEKENDEEDSEGSSDEELETDSEDNLSDLKEDDADSEEEENAPKEEIEKEETTVQEGRVPGENFEDLNRGDSDSESEEKSAPKENSEENEENSVPFTFALPGSYETFAETLKNHANREHVVVERMIKCNHPSLSERNKDKLGLLFAYLLQYLNDLFSEELKSEVMKTNFAKFQLLVPQIYALAQLNNENAHNSVLEVVKEKYEEYKKRPREYPGLEVLIFLKLASVLFPTSDFRHQVVTPCYVFMEQMLNKCKIRTRRDISYGVFISSLVLEYSSLSKRYLPAVINYLSGLLHMAIPKTGVKLLKIPPPFKSTSTLLVLIDNMSLETLNSVKLESADFCEAEITPSYQVRILYNVVKLLEQFFDHYKLLPSHVEIFATGLNYLEMITLTNYPKEVKNSVNNLVELLKKSEGERRLEYLVLEASRPKALRLYEPKIQVVYDGKQHKAQSREKAQMNKLLHKVKREKKGALREIRRDNAFLGRIKINQQLQSDRERKEKVKRIFSEAAVQQSELNEFDRKKKRKH